MQLQHRHKSPAAQPPCGSAASARRQQAAGELSSRVSPSPLPSQRPTRQEQALTTHDSSDSCARPDADAQATRARRRDRGETRGRTSQQPRRGRRSSTALAAAAAAPLAEYELNAGPQRLYLVAHGWAGAVAVAALWFHIQSPNRLFVHCSHITTDWVPDWVRTRPPRRYSSTAPRRTSVPDRVRAALNTRCHIQINK
jgi:hypothetical protein